MERDVLLKKNIVGGFDKKQVMEYITHLQQSCNNRKTREEIEEMRLRIASLREVIKEKDKIISELTSEIDKINNVQLPNQEDESEFEILKRSNEQIEQAKAEAEDITSKISEGIKSKDEKITNLFSKLTSINEEISRFSEHLYDLTDKLDDVPFKPVTENDVEGHELPKFDFDKVAEAIAEEEKMLLAAAEAAERERREAEIKARVEAEEKAQSEAKERAKLEAEQIDDTIIEEPVQEEINIEAESNYDY